MNRLTAVLIVAFSLFFSAGATAGSDTQLITTNEISFTHPVRASRNAAVKIISADGGHGSGIYVIYKKHRAVLTADHVVDSGSIYRVTANGNEVFGVVVWRAADADLALLAIEDGLQQEPIKLAHVTNLEAGTRISYSGFPSSYELLSVNGTISGFDSRGYILMQGFGWFGASGAGVINQANKIVGVVTALPVESFHGHPQVLESLILVTPLQLQHINQIGAVLNVLK